MPFWPIHIGSRWKIQDRRPINNTEIKHNPEKQTMQNTAKTTLVYSPFYDTRPGNELSLFYSVREPTLGRSVTQSVSISECVNCREDNGREYTGLDCAVF